MSSQLTVVDPDDCFTEEGDLPADPKLRAHAIRVAQCIQGAAGLTPGFAREVLVPCRRRAGGVACLGLLWVAKRDDDTLLASCPVCKADEFLIHDWQNTDWAEGPMEAWPVDESPVGSMASVVAAAPSADATPRVDGDALDDALAALQSSWSAAKVRERIAIADTPVEVVDAILASMTRPPPQAAMERLFAALFEAWNATPRPDLGGRTPDAVHAERRPAREAPKVGRNAPCPCGSGKKFKRCCGAS